MTPEQILASCGAKWVGWGRGKFHVQADGSNKTVCGREVPDDARTPIYRPSKCARCVSADPDLADLAEQSRKALFAAHKEQQDSMLERNRRGEFTVWRCRKCGRQHRGHDRNRPGVPYCLEEHHEADLEAIKVIGDPWVEVDAQSEKAA